MTQSLSDSQSFSLGHIFSPVNKRLLSPFPHKGNLFPSFEYFPRAYCFLLLLSQLLFFIVFERRTVTNENNFCLLFALKIILWKR